MITKELLPLIGVFLGWGLHELSSRATSRRADRRAYGECLAALLTIHRYLNAAQQLAMIIDASERDSDRQSPSSLIDNETWLQQTSHLRTVGQRLTGSDPFMAHHILSLLALLEAVLRDSAGSETSSSSRIDPPPELELTEAALLQTAAAALKIAWKHGAVSLYNTWRLGRKPLGVPGELFNAIENLEEWSEQQRLRMSYGRWF